MDNGQGKKRIVAELSPAGKFHSSGKYKGAVGRSNKAKPTRLKGPASGIIFGF